MYTLLLDIHGFTNMMMYAFVESNKCVLFDHSLQSRAMSVRFDYQLNVLPTGALIVYSLYARLA